MKKTVNINLDVKRPTAQQLKLPTLIVGDTGNKFVISMYDDGSALSLTNATKIVVAFSKVSDGSICEQDTEDAVVSLPSIGITLTGTPTDEDTITVVWTSSAQTTTITCSEGLSATLDRVKFGNAYPSYGTYVFTYHTTGFRWQCGDNSVTVSGNVITIDPIKTGSFGAGKNNCEVQLYEGTELITSAQFNFDGRPGIVNETTIQSDEKFPILVDLIRRVEAVEGSSGDMRKSVYDTDDDGKVDEAEHAEDSDHADDSDLLEGHAASYYVASSEFSAHASRHGSSGSDPVTPADIGAIASSTKGEASGVASLDANAKVMPAQASSRIVSQTSSFTLASGQEGSLIKVNSADDVTVTIPANTFDIGTEIEILRYGEGEVTISGATGVTVVSPNSTDSITSQYNVACIKNIGTNEWLLGGDLY